MLVADIRSIPAAIKSLNDADDACAENGGKPVMQCNQITALDVQWYAECDGYTSATSSSRVTAPAALMVVVLKRFDSAGNKIVTPVEVPHVLDMQLAMGNPALASNYQLIGIAHHRGESKNSGHYVAQFMHHEHHEWVEANDRAVVSSPPPTVSSSAYVLLYQRIPPTA